MIAKRALQIAVAVFGLIPVCAGGAGALMGPAMIAHSANLSMDSHFRYLSGLLLGIGLLFWSLIPNIERRTAAFRLLTGIVFVGGLARAYGALTVGVHEPAMRSALVMELVVTPLLCLWQGWVAPPVDRARASV